MSIKNFWPEQASLYEYTREIVVYMVITSKGCLGQDIWPKTPNQGTTTKKMIFTI